MGWMHYEPMGCTVGMHCGMPLWRCHCEVHCGDALWDATVECHYGIPYGIYGMPNEAHLPRKAAHASAWHEHAERRRAAPPPLQLDAPQCPQHGAVRLGASLHRARTLVQPWAWA